MDINKDVLRVFGQFFCMEALYIKTKDGFDTYIYDAPTQYFINLKTKWLIYWVFSDESKQVVNKIVKDNSLNYVSKDNVSMEDIWNFRKIFRNHPEIESQINELVEKYEHPAVELFNTFLSEVAKYKIYKDEDLSYVREFRIYLSKRTIEFTEEYSWDLKNDLYSFLEFDRFNTDEFVKQKADETLNYICHQIDDGKCPDIRKFRNLNDRDQLPDDILSMIEKLVLYNYCDKPNQNVVKEIRTAIEQMDIDFLKEYMDFTPKWWQRYALAYESRENLAVNSRRCMEENSLVRLADWNFKKAKDLEIWDKLLSSDKYTTTKILDIYKKEDHIYKVTLNTWEELLLTWEHRLPTEKSFSINWFSKNENDYTMVKDLKVWDFVPTSLWTNFLWDKYTCAEAELLWYFIGDGSLSTQTITITKYDEVGQQKILNLAEKCWIDAYVWDKNIIRFQWARSLLEKAGLYYSHSYNKHIPNWMFWESANVKWKLIEWLLNTDWYLCINWWIKIEYSSISKELIEWMHIILNDLWIINFYSKKEKKIRLNTLKTDSYEAYYLYISEQESLKKLFRNINLSNKKNYEEFVEILYNKEVIHNYIWTLPTYSYRKDRTIEWVMKGSDRIFNWVWKPHSKYYQRWKAEYYWTEHWLQYQWSQVKSIEYIWKWNVIDIWVSWDHLYWIWDVLSHNSWKSFMVMYIALRQLMLPWQMILYLVPVKEDYSEQPFFYIEQLMENIKKKWAELPWFQFNSKQFRVVNKFMKSKIIFMSAQWNSKGKGYSANLVIVDEAAMIDDEHLYDQAYNSTTDTKWRCWAISTINVETPVNRFFYKKITLEGTEDAKVHNVNLYDNPFIKDAEKAKIEKDLKEKNSQVWMSDWMAIFVWGTEWFDTSKFFQIDFFYDVISFRGMKFNLARNLDKYERFLLFYDPAKNKDKAWIAIIGKIWFSAEVVMTWYIDVKNYYTQREVIMDILNYIWKIKKIELWIDLWKAWEAAFDWFENQRVAPYGILSTGWQQSTQKTYRRWNVPANIMEANLHSLMAAGVVKWFSWLEHIRSEFDTYTLTKERKGWFEQHHDILSALMNACYIWYERWFIKIDHEEVVQEKPKQLVDAFWRPIKRYTNWQFNWNLMWRFLH